MLIIFLFLFVCLFSVCLLFVVIVVAVLFFFFVILGYLKANLHALINRNDLPQFTKKTSERTKLWQYY